MKVNIVTVPDTALCVSCYYLIETKLMAAKEVPSLYPVLISRLRNHL